MSLLMRLVGFAPKDVLSLKIENEGTVYSLNKKEITEMLSLTTTESIILFNMEFYSLIDGVAMRSPLGPTLTNVFLCHHEKK